MGGAQSKTLKVTLPSDALEGEQYKLSILVKDSSGGYTKQSVVVDVQEESKHHSWVLNLCK
ncbi:hypothetical protein O9992_30660 [Vibrio lentus]|nr:hypothetical protein [Vibrio lentus]